MKGIPSRLVRDHYATLVDTRTGRPSLGDWAVFLGVPVVVFGVSAWRHVRLPAVASVGLTTVCGLLSAYLIGVVLQASQRAMDLADAQERPSRSLTRHGDFVRQLAANSGYASLVSFFAAGVFVVAAVLGERHVLLWVSAFGLGVVAHLAVNLLMVIQRVYALTASQIDRATTGANVERLPQRKGQRRA